MKKTLYRICVLVFEITLPLFVILGGILVFTQLAGAVIVLFITLKHKFVAATTVTPAELDFDLIGQQMLSSEKYGYLLPFEAVSVLLLACIVGGLLIARKR